jgi:hypothetical protein
LKIWASRFEGTRDTHLVGGEFLLGGLGALVTCGGLRLGVRSGLFLLGGLLLSLLLTLLELSLGDHLASNFVKMKLGDCGGGLCDGRLA